MANPIKMFRKLAVILIAAPVFIIGLILIPLPGPGLLICFLGLAILSLEFESARKHRDIFLLKIKNILTAGRQKRS